MARFLLVNTTTNLVTNAIELDPSNYTTTFIENDRGDRLPTFAENGVTMVSTTKYLVPEGYEVHETDLGNIGDTWPLTDNGE